jgi:multicomponent Na+:H+ antiporter subunit D
MLNAGYFFPIVIRAFFRSSSDFVRFDEASPFMVVPLLLTAAFAILLGVYPDGIFRFYSLTSAAASSVLAGGIP